MLLQLVTDPPPTIDYVQILNDMMGPAMHQLAGIAVVIGGGLVGLNVMLYAVKHAVRAIAGGGDLGDERRAKSLQDYTDDCDLYDHGYMSQRAFDRKHGDPNDGKSLD